MNFKDEMTETQETIEMATLDREMAEEKVDYLCLQSIILFIWLRTTPHPWSVSHYS